MPDTGIRTKWEKEHKWGKKFLRDYPDATLLGSKDAAHIQGDA